jgi:coxsackievirus/adenovirus receptor
VEGALNLTREAWHRVQFLSEIYDETSELNNEAERQCKRIESLVKRQPENEKFLVANDEQISDLQTSLDELNAKIPDLNEQVCDKRGDPCDSLCGGAGCGKCGGLSCEKGALTRAEQALNYAKDAEKIIKDKEEMAENLIRSISYAKSNALEAHKQAKDTFENVQLHFNATEEQIDKARDLINNLTNIINNNTASPNEIDTIVDQVMQLDLHLEPEEIKHLANQIDQTVLELENVETIIANTRSDLEQVEQLKKTAIDAKERADAVLQRAQDVSNALSDAEEAQMKARDAIRKANNDIEKARSDLEQIDSETIDAHKRANETAEIVEKLTSKLSKLQKKFLKNDFDAKEIKTQVENVRQLANNAHEKASNLKNSYKNANETLTQKSITSEGARERAQMLLMRASKITVDTTRKFQELKEMGNVYQSNEQELSDLQKRVESLNAEIDSYVQKIQGNADYYRQCTS